MGCIGDPIEIGCAPADADLQARPEGTRYSLDDWKAGLPGAALDRGDRLLAECGPASDFDLAEAEAAADRPEGSAESHAVHGWIVAWAAHRPLTGGSPAARHGGPASLP